jgi:hypothetical protein
MAPTKSGFRTDAQKRADKVEYDRKLYLRKKQKRENGLTSSKEDKAHDRKLACDRDWKAAKREDPEWRSNRKAYESADNNRDSQRASNMKWRNSDKGKAWYAEQFIKEFEALRRAFIKEWYDFVDSGADSDITQDDMDNLKSVTASTISAEVTRFLDEEKLDDGPCKDLTFTV